jgi:hypothetical protein
MPARLVVPLFALVLAGCAASDSGNQVEDGVAYRSVMVGASVADGFYFTPLDQWMAMEADESGRRAALILANSSGPIRSNTAVRMQVGRRYLVVPVCAGAPRWDKAIEPQILHQAAVSVSC